MKSELKPFPTPEEMKLFVEQIPGPINEERYPNTKRGQDLATVRAARHDGRYLDLDPIARRILEGRFPVEDEAPRSFSQLGKELGSSASSARSSYEHIMRKLREK